MSGDTKTVPAPDDFERFLEECADLSAEEQDRIVQALCAQYPDRAEEIRDRVSLLNRLDRVFRDAKPGETRRPDHIGRYRVLDVLGTGGMGIVYLAEQREPVRRRVAVKVIKLGMDSEQVLARFAVERQALAVMNHSSIAKVLDAGTTPEGQSYFVMEYFEGLPVTTFCDKHRLGLAARIELFIEICGGVQHAHQKGVVHRDLKPGNILVTREGDRPVPKIIDFGLARAVDQVALQHSQFTEHGQILGTPEYMSPEQATMDAEGVDTRTDVYSLGVMLYELLTGELPFPSDALRQGGLLEIQRRIAHEEPVKPSSRIEITHSAGDARSYATSRRTTVASLAKQLRGDLDWIVMRAMAKERERRYGSATQLAEDLQRYLRSEAVSAGPPSVGYRLQKWLARHRVWATAGALVVLTTAAGTIAVMWQAGIAMDQRDLAEARSKDLTEAKAALDLENRRFRLARYAIELEEIVEEARALFPAWPHNVAALERWLERIRPLQDARPEVEAALESIKRRAAPVSNADERRVADYRAEHVEHLRAHLASTRRAIAVYQGRARLVEPELTTIEGKPIGEVDHETLARYGRERAGSGAHRKVWNEEATGLAAIRRAIETARSAGAPRGQLGMYYGMLAEALLANGLLDEVEPALAKGFELSGRDPRFGHNRDKMLATCRDLRAGGRYYELFYQRRIAVEERRASSQRTWEFLDSLDRFQQRTLDGFLDDLVDAETKTVPDVRDRLTWAQRVRELTIERFADRWKAARVAILRADGKTASADYRKAEIDLEPQLGLVPIGMNPRTGLWEFYHLRSAWNLIEAQDPGAIEIPRHAADGSIPVEEGTGIIFVLLPGGTFEMGEQGEDPGAPHYSPRPDPDAKLHTVRLAPFFIARHELTQGQWMRLRAEKALPCAHPYGFYGTGMRASVTLAHPVEHVTWVLANHVMEQQGLTLPTEAQWEYAAKGGKPTCWFSGPDIASVEGKGNLADAFARGHARWPVRYVPWSDGHLIHAPVGSFAPNDFGLHDVIGNVQEWCLDGRTAYTSPVKGDAAERVVPKVLHRVIRDGGYTSSAWDARATARHGNKPDSKSGFIGLRAARRIL